MQRRSVVHNGMKTLDPQSQSGLDLPFPLLRSERDRDIFDLEDRLLIVANDGIAACGWALHEGIPPKGRVLAGLARFWFDATEDLVPNPLVGLSADGVSERTRSCLDALGERCIVLRKVDPCQVKCAVYGCLTGAAYDEYGLKGSVCGLQLPSKLRKGARLQGPLFTASLDLGDGSSRSITMSEMMDMVGIKALQQMKERSIALYLRGYRLAWDRGILLADARFEFGWLGSGILMLADEVLTPSSSRYWSMDDWKPGLDPPRMDRRPLLDYLRAEVGWDGRPPVPCLPHSVVEAIRRNYLDLAQRFGIALSHPS